MNALSKSEPICPHSFGSEGFFALLFLPEKHIN